MIRRSSLIKVGGGILLVCSSTVSFTLAWTTNSRCCSSTTTSTRSRSLFSLRAVPGADIEQPPIESASKMISSSKADVSSGLSSLARGKLNEIDFCIAPADVSLSRAYGVATAASSSTPPATSTAAPPVLSLTRALNDASNRVVRRILLARSWPSAEALNLSLRRAAAAEKEREKRLYYAQIEGGAGGEAEGMKCPVPRPILNVLMRKRGDKSGDTGDSAKERQPIPRSRTDEEYVADQLKSFKERYGELSGYIYAEAYLESILSLATAGVESKRVEEVLQSGVYDESYRRVISVLRSVGVQFENYPETGRNRIASKLVDQDICLSMLDLLRMRSENERDREPSSEKGKPPSNAKPLIKQSASGSELDGDDVSKNKDGDDVISEPFSKPARKFWTRGSSSKSEEEKSDSEVDELLTREDLGGVLLSSEEPSITRQLNVLSNIVQRALLFGGDEELLVLAETLEADRAAFVDRWYPNTGPPVIDGEEESRPGVQFLNCLVQLLRDCYDNGVVTNLEPPLPLSQSYANSYERLVATSVELGSGYIKPAVSDVMTMPKPRTAKEELGRFAVWESTFRQKNPDTSSYPEDLEGVWEVCDEIGGETIGKSIVVLGVQGKVEVNPPLEGLRWRLDPGPTHLDTCTFQVLSTDGTILQYRGFIDRGARLESRFSKRPIKIRGSVMFQMRDGTVDYYKDMLPINYLTATTKFVMTKVEAR